MTDVEAEIVKIFNHDWNKKVVKPWVFYDDISKTADTSNGKMKVYYDDNPDYIPRGIGYSAMEVEEIVYISVESESRRDIYLIRDEVMRILKTHRVKPFAGYDFWKWSGGEKINNFAHNYKFLIELRIKELRRPLG